MDQLAGHVPQEPEDRLGVVLLRERPAHLLDGALPIHCGEHPLEILAGQSTQQAHPGRVPDEDAAVGQKDGLRRGVAAQHAGSGQAAQFRT